MSTVKIFDTIIAPIYSEKATNLTESSKYTFKVATVATKADVKKAVETIFGVKVTGVNIIVTKPKTKIFRGVKGKRSAFKKALVTLEKGKSLDLTKGA